MRYDRPLEEAPMPGFDRTTLGMMAMFTLGAPACSTERATIGTSSGPGAGAGGATSATHGSGAGPASSSAIVAGSAGVGGGGSGGGGPFVCDPPAAAGSLYAQTGDAFGALDPISMCQYRGDVLLIVNTAAL
jgi:hypothetical protein